jgi:zinc transporter
MGVTEQGFFHSVILDQAGGLIPVGLDRYAELCAAGVPLWVHLDYEHPAARQWLKAESGLNDIALAGLVAEETRPRVLTRGENLLLTLRGINLNPGEQPDDMVSVRIWTNGVRVISAQRRRLVATDDVLGLLQQGLGPRDIPSLLVAWTDQLVFRMTDTIDDLEDRVAQLEERALLGDRKGLRHDFAQLRKMIIVLRRYLAPQREALAVLTREPLLWIDELNRTRMREVADRLIRHIEDMDAVRDRAAVAQEELLSLMSEEMNTRMYVMSIVAALFLPLGFFTGLMGINVGGMPGVENNAGFWWVVAMCGLTLVGLLGLFKIRRWF